MINNQVTLVDASFWQDDDFTPYKINFAIMQSKGVDGVILRAGQNTWNDEDFMDYVRNVKLTTLPWGSYFLYDSRSNPLSQADRFADLITLTGFPPLGIWGDYEENYGGPFKGEVNFKIFLDRLRVRFPGKLVGIYTGPAYWIANTTSAFRTKFADFPLWIAHYGVINPTIPTPWLTYVLWQYTEHGDGYYYGAESSRLDMNIFRGTFQEYIKYFALNIEPPPPPTGDEMYKCKVKETTTPWANLRELPSVTSMDLGNVLPGTEFTADKLQDGWLHSITAGIVGWISAGLCDYSVIVEPPPTTTTKSFTLSVKGYKPFTGELEQE